VNIYIAHYHFEEISSDTKPFTEQKLWMSSLHPKSTEQKGSAKVGTVFSLVELWSKYRSFLSKS